MEPFFFRKRRFWRTGSSWSWMTRRTANSPVSAILFLVAFPTCNIFSWFVYRENEFTAHNNWPAWWLGTDLINCSPQLCVHYDRPGGRVLRSDPVRHRPGHARKGDYHQISSRSERWALAMTIGHWLPISLSDLSSGLTDTIRVFDMSETLADVDITIMHIPALRIYLFITIDRNTGNRLCTQ